MYDLHVNFTVITNRPNLLPAARIKAKVVAVENKGAASVRDPAPAAWAAREAIMTNNRAWTRLILTSALAGGLLFAVGTTARADRDWGPDCSRRLEADRARIDHDASRFGNESRQVNRDVARMDTDRQWCRDHKADWDHNRFDVGIYFHK